MNQISQFINKIKNNNNNNKIIICINYSNKILSKFHKNVLCIYATSIKNIIKIIKILKFYSSKKKIY
jgi:hypothetical protein